MLCNHLKMAVMHPMFWPSFVYFGAAMTTVGGVHRGYLRKYGGFMFKQWKDKYVVLSMEGSLLVCRDGESPPDQVVDLQSHCEVIVEGREILDLPRLPAGGRRDCCFALVLQQSKFLLMLADNPDDCTWVSPQQPSVHFLLLGLSPLNRRDESVAEADKESERGCHVTRELAEAAQRHPLHHRQGPAARLRRQQGPRVAPGQRGYPAAVGPRRREGRITEREKSESSWWTTATPAQCLRGPPSPGVGLSSPRQQQRRPSGAGRVPVDGERGSLLGHGLPQLLLPVLAVGRQSDRNGPRRLGGLLGNAGRGVVSRLWPGRRLRRALQQLRL
ncbi:uncharacterized protein si:ch1073-83n3.2 isoform X1 [Phycodurus eques]|uniref:uncharacterized protein si:ch1073-83n3.2 isoform X1 n=1 Tax=Phycodurus eques TaxID=693459 RepID=UPI002ACE08FC|nr:uncharacterized protein si:ch1073-83n3.2 isoform X1 [Phycodurus eques]